MSKKLRNTSFLVLLFFSLHSKGFSFLYDTSIEARVSAYFPNSSLFQEIYGIWPSYQLQSTQELCPSFSLWENITYLYAEGNSTALDYHTHLHFLPLSTGLYYTLPLAQRWKGRVGLGPAYSFLWMKDSSEFVRRHTFLQGLGCIFKSQLAWKIECFSFSLFLDYFLQKLENNYDTIGVENFDVEMSGLFFGIALGYFF